MNYSTTTIPNFDIEEIKRRLSIEDYLSQQTGQLGKKVGKGRMYLCPLHSERTASFSVDPIENVWHCFGCNASGDVINLIEQIENLDRGAAIRRAADLAGVERTTSTNTNTNTKPWNKPGSKIIATYDYTDESGNLLYQNVRYSTLEEPKNFFARRPNGAGGWIESLGEVRRVPYRLPELIAADPGAPVYLVEGEKDVDNLRAAGLVATNSKNWKDDFSLLLAGRKVSIIPDNDEPGRAVAQTAFSSIFRVASSIKQLELDVPPKGDVSNWLEAGHTAEELVQLAMATPSVKDVVAGAQLATVQGSEPKAPAKQRIAMPEILTAGQLLAKKFAPKEYLVEGLLPEKGMGVLGGAAKVGKSFLLLELAVSVATGGKFLGTRQCKQAGVLYLSLESYQERDQERLEKRLPDNIDPETLPLHMTWRWNALSRSEGGMAQIEQFIEEHPDVKLIIVDILQAVRPTSGKRRGDAYQEDYSFLHPIRQFAFENGLQIITSTHTNKSTWDNPFDAFQGSTGIQGASSVNLILSEKEGKHVLAVKGNDCEPQKLALEFDSESGSFVELGDAREFAVTDIRQKILDLLKDYPKGLTAVEVADNIGEKHSTVRQRLFQMHRDGTLDRSDRGGLFSLAEVISHNTRNSNNSNNSHNTRNTSPEEEDLAPTFTESVTTIVESVTTDEGHNTCHNTDLEPSNAEAVESVTTVTGVMHTSLKDFNRSFQSITASRGSPADHAPLVDALRLRSHDVLSPADYYQFEQKVNTWKKATGAGLLL